MVDDSHVHGFRPQGVYIVSLINNYAIKWGAADVLIFFDVLQNAVWSSKYDAIGAFFGIKGGTINSAISLEQ